MTADAAVSAELVEWQKRLAEKKEELAKLKDALAKAHKSKEASQQACQAGAAAAKSQMLRLRAELTLARQRLAANAREKAMQEAAAAQAQMAPADGAEGVDAGVDNSSAQPASLKLPGAELDKQNALRKALELKERAMRQEVERWKHQVASEEKRRPREEALLVRLKAELTHQIDILESTRQAVKHEEVERELERQGMLTSQLEQAAQSTARTLPPEDVAGASQSYSSQQSRQHASKSKVSNLGEPVPLFGGGHGGIEARAEREMRQRFEEEGEMLSGKVKQLLGITAAQELLRQRLEKALIKEETELEQRDRQLSFQVKRSQSLQRGLRRRSDEAVAVALGFAGARRRAAAEAMAAADPHGRGASFLEQKAVEPSAPGAAGNSPCAGPTSTVPYPEPCLQFGSSASAPQLPPLEAR
eukprot:TRINITY_DN10279_c0_g1_i1.p1 TRINITY_DN10279_c0_g1~~TRINITY_DN10279_c0_g1_i1.p1  ORF type:complete len:417 (-),score=166.41 TRINITY_DN10279_c0_g1_i1:100-1350(-)